MLIWLSVRDANVRACVFILYKSFNDPEKSYINPRDFWGFFNVNKCVENIHAYIYIYTCWPHTAAATEYRFYKIYARKFSRARKRCGRVAVFAKTRQTRWGSSNNVIHLYYICTLIILLFLIFRLLLFYFNFLILIFHKNISFSSHHIFISSKFTRIVCL